MTTPVRIVLADDHKILRDGLESLLQKEPTFDVVGTAENGREALKLTADLQPDVLILDIGMPEMNGIDVAQQISQEFPAVKMIGLSVHTDPLYVERMFQNGAVGYLPKDCAAEELCSAIRKVASGGTYIGRSLSDTILRRFIGGSTKDRPGAIDRLSNRERQVLQLLAEGHSAKKSAERLSISAKTIEVHRKNIRQKLGISSIAELTKYAIRMGITQS
jgi:two-component system response regulator NreC